MEGKKTGKELLLGELGKYCMDISKLVFGGIILAGVMELDVDKALLFGIGFAAVLIMAVAGLLFNVLLKLEMYGTYLFFMCGSSDWCSRYHLRDI